MKRTIGRIELVDFPDFEFESIQAKIDTGAYTSSIHCTSIKKIKIDGVSYLKFVLLDSNHSFYNGKEFLFKDFDQKVVTSSNGITQERYAIKTNIKLFETLYNIELTLSNRINMRYPILIGRKFLKQKFIVDPSFRNLSHKLKSTNTI